MATDVPLLPPGMEHTPTRAGAEAAIRAALDQAPRATVQPDRRDASPAAW